MPPSQSACALDVFPSGARQRLCGNRGTLRSSSDATENRANLVVGF
jgi:hypothetical protein